MDLPLLARGWCHGEVTGLSLSSVIISSLAVSHLSLSLTQVVDNSIVHKDCTPINLFQGPLCLMMSGDGLSNYWIGRVIE